MILHIIAGENNIIFHQMLQMYVSLCKKMYNAR